MLRGNGNSMFGWIQHISFLCKYIQLKQRAKGTGRYPKQNISTELSWYKIFAWSNVNCFFRVKKLCSSENFDLNQNSFAYSLFSFAKKKKIFLKSPQFFFISVENTPTYTYFKKSVFSEIWVSNKAFFGRKTAWIHVLTSDLRKTCL